MVMNVDRTIPYTELPPAQPSSPLAREWELFRREVGRLLAEGNEGKTVLIKSDEIIGIYATEREARDEGYRRFPGQAFLAKPVLSREPLLRIRTVL